MDPHYDVWAVAVTAIREHLSVPAIVQALVVAGVTASATGYVSAQVLRSEVGYLRETIERLDRDQRATAAKIAEIEVRQARVIGQADLIHGAQDRRIERLEARR